MKLDFPDSVRSPIPARQMQERPLLSLPDQDWSVSWKVASSRTRQNLLKDRERHLISLLRPVVKLRGTVLFEALDTRSLQSPASKRMVKIWQRCCASPLNWKAQHEFITERVVTWEDVFYWLSSFFFAKFTSRALRLHTDSDSSHPHFSTNFVCMARTFEKWWRTSQLFIIWSISIILLIASRHFTCSVHCSASPVVFWSGLYLLCNAFILTPIVTWELVIYIMLCLSHRFYSRLRHLSDQNAYY